MGTLAGQAQILDFPQNVANGGTALTVPAPPTLTSVVTLNNASACVLTFPTNVAGRIFDLILVQDATGGRPQPTFPGSVIWLGGQAPFLPSGASQAVHIRFIGDGTSWYGLVSRFTTPWQNVTPGTNLSNLGSGFATLQCRRMDGLVIVKGVLLVGVGGLTASQTLCTLPAGFRPAQSTAFGGYLGADFIVLSTGVINNGAALSAAQTVSLACVFAAEQ